LGVHLQPWNQTTIIQRHTTSFLWTMKSQTAKSNLQDILCGNKMPTRCNRWIFIADLIVCSTCFRHLYAHHQEL
jgi:hypothetical protein